MGLKTKEVDPVGRESVFVYGANNVADPVPATGRGLDLLQAKRKNGAGYDLVASYVYDTKHRPTSVTDGAGKTTTYTYNARGQIATVTTPPRAGITENRTTTYGYDSLTGLLLSVTSPGSVTTTYTYDAEARVKSVTDVNAYTVSYEYDPIDRVTKTSYPDGTFEEMQYERLDPVRRRDRLGAGRTRSTMPSAAWSRLAIPRGAPWGRIGASAGAWIASSIPNGNATTWERDLQARVTKETRANASFKTYTYETTTQPAQEDDRRQTARDPVQLWAGRQAAGHDLRQRPEPNA